MNLDDIRELIMLLDQTSIAELEVQQDNYRLSLRKAGTNVKEIPAPAAVVMTQKQETSETSAAAGHDLAEVVAPMVGTFYSAPSPDSPAYVKIGDHVDSGQTLCILEAMKLMNEIKSECSGTIADILVKNAEAVEYGQVLFLIERD